MITKVEQFLQRDGILPKGAPVIVAVSGGADSMALLHILCRLRVPHGWDVRAAHVNHCLRGEESERDEAFVRSICKQWQVPLAVKRVDVRALAAERKEGLEACGRRERYAFFASLQEGACIATAHTQSDRAETFLFHATRGTALQGLCSLPAQNGNVLRPLLGCSRAEVEQYCSEQGIAYVEDCTNKDVRYARNRIRHQVMPQLKKINPAVEQSIGRCMTALELDRDFLEEQAASLQRQAETPQGYRIDALEAAHPALRTRVIRNLLQEKTGQAPDAAMIHRVEKLLEVPGVTQVKGNGAIQASAGLLFFSQAWPVPQPFCIPATPGTHEILEAGCRVEIIYRNDVAYTQNVQKEILANCLNCDTIKGSLFLRNRLPGDRLRLAGRQGTKSLKKWMNERAVPLELRERLVVLADDAGVVWVEQFGCAARCCVTPGTARMLTIAVQRN